MTTIIRRKRTSRLQIGPYRRNELLTGRIVYPVQGYTGYGDGIGTDLTRSSLIRCAPTGKPTARS